MTTQPILGLALFAATAAQAHVTLDQGEAPAGSSYKAVFKVGHGCEGGLATRQIIVTPPPGLRNAKPMPKAGWTLAIAANGDISWTARTEVDYVQDAWYDEFTIRTTLPEEPGVLWFKVRQGCVGGEANWADVPAAGSDSTKGLKQPAARLLVTPRTSAMPEGHHH